MLAGHRPDRPRRVLESEVELSVTGHLDDVAERLRRGIPGTAIDRLEALGEGDYCRAYLLNGRRVVRVPRNAAAGRALAREACLMTRIADRLPVDVPVPKTVVEPGSSTVSFSIHDAIAGTELTRELWLDLPAPTRSRLAREVGVALRALHAIDPVVGRGCRLEGVDYGARMRELRRRIYAPEGGVLPEALKSALAEAFDRYLVQRDEWRFEPALLHADVSPDHVLVDADRHALTGIIDWSDVCIGDPARDFIYLYEDWGGDFLALTLEAYAPRERERFESRIYLHYLAEQLEWTLAAAAEAAAGQGSGATAQVIGEAVAMLGRALGELEKCLASLK